MPDSHVSARKSRLVLLGLLLLSAACGCASAVRFVRETPDGGVVVMPTNTNQWPTYYRSRAEYLMHQKCPGGFQIDHEAAVGGELGKRIAYDSYFGYTGGSEAEQVYHITFHAVPSGNQRAAAAVPDSAKKPASSARPSVPPSMEGKDELPPPRPLPSLPEAEEKNP